MPTSADPDAFVDTSVAVPRILKDHDAHTEVSDALTGRRLGLSGHAAFETYSVLTRMPPPLRLTATEAEAALRVNFPATRHLGAAEATELLDQLAERAISGGAVYDALVGAVAREHEVLLFTRDARAASTYRALGVTFELLTQEASR